MVGGACLAGCCGSTAPCNGNDISTTLTLTISKLSGVGTKYIDQFIGSNSITWQTITGGTIYYPSIGNVPMNSAWITSCVGFTYSVTSPFFPYTVTTYNEHVKPVVTCMDCASGTPSLPTGGSAGPQTLYFNISYTDDSTGVNCDTTNRINAPFYGNVSNETISYSPYLHVYDYIASSNQYQDGGSGTYRITISE